MTSRLLGKKSGRSQVSSYVILGYLKMESKKWSVATWPSSPSFSPSPVLRQQLAAILLNQIQMVIEEGLVPVRTPIRARPIMPVVPRRMNLTKVWPTIWTPILVEYGRKVESRMGKKYSGNTTAPCIGVRGNQPDDCWIGTAASRYLP